MADQLPVDQIVQLRQQGYSNNQIVQQLQRQGYSAQQIYDAMSQADVSKFTGAPVPQEAPSGEAPPQPEQSQQAPPPPPPQESDQYSQEYAQQYPSQYPQQYPSDIDERISETAEAIINEKWDELVAEVKKVIDWKEKTDSQIKKLSDDIQHLKDQFSELHKGILGRISEYDENIRNVGSELKAVEKVFKDVVPSLAENVNELSRLTKNLKKKK